MARLTLDFLGTFQITLDSLPVTRFRSSKNAGLLVYLSLQSDRPFQREVLAALLWPEASEIDARNNLRQAVYQVRKVLGDLEKPDRPYLLVTRQTVQFNAESDFTLDVSHFWQSVNSGNLEAAVAVYHDDLLPGFTCDSLPFEDWLRHEREQMHQTALEAMSTVTQNHLKGDRPELALAVARQQLSLEPWRESAYRQLMTAYALAGDRGNALAQFEQCREVLWEELGVEPAVETVNLYESIKLGDYVPISEDRILEAPDEVRSNLPAYTTPLIGREAEIASLSDFIMEPNIYLITIVGPGGIGKTRLAIAAAERALTTGNFQEGSFFIDLVPLQEAGQILPTLAETLNYPFQEGDDPEFKRNFLEYIRPMRMLIIFDNFEHLLDGAELVSDILQAVKGVNILVTSRERLNLKLEHLFPIDGLALPDPDSTADMESYSAVRLFLQSAQRNLPDFTPRDDRDLAYLVRICHMVAGMPLALELAASWVDKLTLEEIASELQLGLDLLETELRDLPERQHSVRATFDYTWRRLEAGQQAIFNQISIFRGGFTRAAAQAVTGASLRQLSTLVNKSLIRFDTGRGRYEIHELLRQYGAEKLAGQPEQEAAARNRHSTFYLQMLAGYTDAFKGKGKKQALSAIEADLKNVRLAWDHATVHHYFEAISESVEALWRFFLDTGRPELKEFEQAAAELRKGEAVGARGIALGRVLAPLGRIYGYRGDNVKARGTLQESLELLQRIGGEKEGLIPFLFLAEVQDSMEESRRLYQEGLALARAFNDPWAIGHALLHMIGNARLTGNYQEAQQFGREALNQFKENGDPGGIAASLYELSLLAFDMGRYEEGLTLAQETKSVTQGYSQMLNIMGMLPLGLALYFLGQYDEAEKQFRRMISIIREFGQVDWEVGRYFLGEIAFRKREYDRAFHFYTDSLATSNELGNLHFIVLNHNSLSSLYLAQGREIEAREHLRTALQGAIQLTWRPLILDCFVGIAELLLEEGDLENAALLATFVTADPASQAMTKERGERLLAHLEKDLPLDRTAALRRRSQTSDLGSLAAELLSELETP